MVGNFEKVREKCKGRFLAIILTTYVLIDGRRWVLLPSPEGLTYTQEECFHRCPELNGCINATLWCDGAEHCPSGYDESITHCFFLLQMPALYVIIILTSFTLISCSTLLVCYRFYKHQMAMHSLPTDTESIFGPREVICWHIAESTTRYIEVDRVTTVWQAEVSQYGVNYRLTILRTRNIQNISSNKE